MFRCLGGRTSEHGKSSKRASQSGAAPAADQVNAKATGDTLNHEAKEKESKRDAIAEPNCGNRLTTSVVDTVAEHGNGPDTTAASGCPFMHAVERGAPASVSTVPAQTSSDKAAIFERAAASVSKCPLGHGSVGAGPFPGYVHGRHPEICAHGCKPDPALDKYGRKGETPLETLIREALEYQELYHREKGSSEEVKKKRIAEILAEIDATGTYYQTFDELQHGARVAWRNAPKCSNRKFWEELQLMDYRHVDSPEGMYLACLELLEAATLSCVTTANIAVFRAQTPGTQDGPRVWNTQLIRYAGYTNPDGTVLGEKAEAAFTTMLQEELGWKPPPQDKRTRFDVLPVVLQAHPDQEPKVFNLPPQYVARVPITHPSHPQFAELGLQWYAVPAVSCLELSVGGLTYTGVPFNGWYAVTEIVRNLTEECRYDQCAVVAKMLGLDTRSDGNMWRDQAIVTITQAVMHSFREASYGMVDHHTLMKNFWGWYNKEKERRGYCPGNWKWIIPPVSPTASRCYLELNHMTEYTIKPGYWYAPMWRSYLERLKARRAAAAQLEDGHARAADALTNGEAAVAADGGADKSGGKGSIVIAYASVTGTTAKYAEAVAGVFSSALPVRLLNMEDFEPDGWAEAIADAPLVILMTSTYGPGAPPSAAGKFIGWLQKGLALGGEAHEVLNGRPFAVVGFGCSSYPRFCAAADSLYSLVSATGATPITPVTKVDSLSHEEVTVWGWANDIIALARRRGLATPEQAEAVLARVPMTTDGKPKPFVPAYTLIDLSGVEGIRPAVDRFRQEAVVVEVKELIRSAAEAKAAADKGAAPAPATRQVILDVSGLPGGGLSYHAGDELAVWAENPADAVEQVALGLGLTGDKLDSFFLLQRKALVAVAGGAEGPEEETEDAGGMTCAPFPLPNTFRTVLSRYVSLCDVPSYEAVRALAGYAPQDAWLKAIAQSYDAYQEWVTETGTRWCDMWNQFPALAGLPPAVFFQLATVIKSRHYSISSSSSLRPGQLHLTVSRLAYRLPSGELRYGLCSNFLGSRRPGDKVAVKVLPTPGFRMPLDPAAPVVMVAAGAGLAPFKSFWEERLARQVVMQQEKESTESATAAVSQPQMGPGVLIFGCRNSQDDFIYCDTIQEALSEGVLSSVFTAFSREARGPGSKRYVQDVVAAHAEELAPLLRHRNAHVYICGSSNMAQEVAVAFRKLLGAGEFTALVQSGRYHEDVFGMVVPDHRAAVKSAAAKGAVTLLGASSAAEVAELLDGGGLSLDAVDHSYSTLLHVAVKAGNAALVELLLERGAAPNVLDMYGCTPLQLAQLADNKELVALLEARGGRLVSRLVSNFYPVHTAVMEGSLEAVTEAIASGADLSAAEYHGLTPLHVACAVAGPPIIQALISAGAPLDAVSRRGLLPLQLALVLQRKEAVALLQAANAPLVVKQVVTAGESGSAEGGGVAWNPGVGPALATEELAALQGSWAFLSGSAFPAERREKLEAFGVEFFLCLFDQCPGLLSLFPFKDASGKPILEELKVHGVKVLTMLGQVVQLFANMPVLVRATEDLTERHISYGVELAHYSVLFTLLAQVLSQALGPKWDGPTAAAWTKVGALVCGIAEGIYKKHQGGTGVGEGDHAPDQGKVAASSRA